MSVATLLTMPRAKGLFRRAIVQSGDTPSVTSAATAARIGRRLAEKLGVAPNREAIAAISPERVLQAERTGSPEGVTWLNVDGCEVSQFGTAHPEQADAAHRGRRPLGVTRRRS